MIDPTQDGITHINIYSKGKTELGRLLSNFAHTPFRHTKYGLFQSVEGFWYWFRTGMMHDGLRDLYGYEAKARGKQFAIIECLDFQNEILEAIRSKLRQNRPIAEMLMQSTLPLQHYYCYSSKVIELPQYQWITDEFTRIRDLMRNKYGLPRLKQPTP